MVQTPDVKREGMHLRLDAKAQAHDRTGRSLPEDQRRDFVLASAIAAAAQVIDAHETIGLSARNWDLFQGALVNLPEPNNRLK